MILERSLISLPSITEKTDEFGTPIIDEPLLSPKRIFFSILRWLWWTIRGKEHSFLEFLLYSRRPFASYKKGLY